MHLIGSDLVSAIIPTRNRPELVVKAVHSALHQTHRRMEVIVVIDGEDRTTEDSVARIKDPRLRVIPLVASVGGAEARNIGVRCARGKWIAFLDDDDEWLSSKIALQLAATKGCDSPFPVISSNLIVRTPVLDFIGPRRSYSSGRPLCEHLFFRQDLVDGPYAMQTSTLLMPRELMIALPFRRGLKRHQDWDWLLRVSSQPGVVFDVISEPLTILRVEDSRPSVSRGLDWEFSFQWAREMRPFFTPQAYSFFIATECVSRAIKKRAGIAAHARLGWECFVRGAPTVRSVAWLAAFACVPHSLRARLRLFLRRRPAPQSATLLSQTCSGIFPKAVNLKTSI